MKCLSIQAPWAEAIALGWKDVENRSWSTDYRGPLLIHCGKKVDKEGFEWLREFGCPEPEVRTGGIIGATNVVDCTRRRQSAWHAVGQYGWYLEGSVLFHEIWPMNGRLGLFNVAIDEDLARQMEFAGFEAMKAA